MNNFNKFISGREYSLKDLFGDDNQIVIPDLQRDYCWGDNACSGKDSKPQELVSGFLKNIIELYSTDAESPVTLGLVYGYEQPYKHIQICDGQQRLTTLFLLLGVINTKCKDCNLFDRYIISEQEMADDYEPHLLYAIRESTLYFLSDLSLHLFINREFGIKGIRTSNWYFQEYDQDATIQSMISAVEIISGILDSYADLDYCQLGDYVLNNLRVLYYDMENRSRGEETYVVINTTGEPLSATENIKPILLGNPTLSENQSKKYSDQWEDREEWFWQHRGTDKTSDSGMHTFFTWYWQIGLQQEYRWEGDKRFPLNVNDLFLSAPDKIKDNVNETKPSKENYEKFRSLDNLDDYFRALKSLVNVISTKKQIQKVLRTMNPKGNTCDLSNESDVWTWLRSADLDVVLPLLCFVNKYGDSELLCPFVRRIRKNHFDSVWNRTDENHLSRKSAHYVDWRYIVQIIDKSEAAEVLKADIDKLDISKIPNIPVNGWYSDEEIWKTRYSAELCNVEEMEDHPLLMGDLTALRCNTNGQEYDLPTISRRWKNLQRIYNAFDATMAKEDMELSNWFRLYCVVTGITPIEHIRNCKWDFEGCFFSKRRETPWWIESRGIDELLCSDNLLDDVKKTIKAAVDCYIRFPHDHKELIISWLVLKTIRADKDRILLSHWNDRAVSAYIEMAMNYIVPYDDFHWGNVLCGYSYSYTIKSATDEQNWNSCLNLDSPVSSLPFIADFCDRDKQCISDKDIKRYDGEINALIDGFWETV